MIGLAYRLPWRIDEITIRSNIPWASNDSWSIEESLDKIYFSAPSQSRKINKKKNSKEAHNLLILSREYPSNSLAGSVGLWGYDRDLRRQQRWEENPLVFIRHFEILSHSRVNQAIKKSRLPSISRAKEGDLQEASILGLLKIAKGLDDALREI